MDDRELIAALRDEMDRALADGSPYSRVSVPLTALSRLLARVEDAEKDAERYRWLRERVYKDEGRLHCMGPNVDHLAYAYTGEALDFAIDAAILADATKGPRRE